MECELKKRDLRIQQDIFMVVELKTISRIIGIFQRKS
jgi:hypothetical protein